LKNFILVGYQDPEFHRSGNQKELDQFFEGQKKVISGLAELEEEAPSNNIGIFARLDSLKRQHNALIDTVEQIRKLYLLKGFKDYGTENVVRTCAHYLEDSCSIDKVDILFIRRREKDYMLRDERRYVTEFNNIANKLLAKYSRDSKTLNALINYKEAFNDFANYSARLSIYTDQGMYGHSQDIINQLDLSYSDLNVKVEKQVAWLSTVFNIILISTFIILLLASVYLSIALSNNLTRDIQRLNKNVAAYVSSYFKDDEVEPLTSRITEIQELNNNFIALKTALGITLSNLQAAINEEKNVAVELEISNIKLREQLKATENLKHQIEHSEAILDAFFQSSSICHILIGNKMDVLAYNKAAASLILDVSGKEICKSSEILSYIENNYVFNFLHYFQEALSGKTVHVEQTLVSRSNINIIWDVSFVPVIDNEGVIFAVSFNAIKSGAVV
jgi:3-dehydroquinate dehydratase